MTEEGGSLGPRRERVLLLSMPFGALERPALSLGLLQEHCRRLGVECEARYLTFDFADLVGVDDYLWISSDEVPYTAFAGDWLFTPALYGPRPEMDRRYVDDVLVAEWRMDPASVARLVRMRGAVAPFLDRCLRSLPWRAFTMVGFTSVFQQNIASLALARRVKRLLPALTVAFGGANWEEQMGVALQQEFPFVDLAFSGEADESFPAVLAARAAGRPVDGIPGVSVGGEGRREPVPAGRVEDLDRVPVPDYDAFFARFERSSAAHTVAPTLLVETARGCWWGERSHCTFCGLNGSTMAFRSKSPDRVLRELTALRDRFGPVSVSVVDDILDMRFFTTVLPRLADARLGVDFFWEVKANLTPDQVRLLRDAGVSAVQPGIESLSDHVLKLMRKGTTAFRNIEMLKWCREYGVRPFWNLLYGFPGETAEDYARTTDLMRSIWHLDPPTAYGPIRLDRFSPYHRDPAAFGMRNVRPMEPFRHLYPFDDERVMGIAYYFEFDYEDGRAADEHAGETVDLLLLWMADRERGEVVMECRDGRVAITDSRGAGRPPRSATLDGWKAAVYLACDRSRPLTDLRRLPAVLEAGATDAALDTFLHNCVTNRVMVRSERSFLNVAVHVPAREPSPTAPEAVPALA